MRAAMSGLTSTHLTGVGLSIKRLRARQFGVGKCNNLIGITAVDPQSALLLTWNLAPAFMISMLLAYFEDFMMRISFV